LLSGRRVRAAPDCHQGRDLSHDRRPRGVIGLGVLDEAGVVEGGAAPKHGGEDRGPERPAEMKHQGRARGLAPVDSAGRRAEERDELMMLDRRPGRRRRLGCPRTDIGKQTAGRRRNIGSGVSRVGQAGLGIGRSSVSTERRSFAVEIASRTQRTLTALLSMLMSRASSTRSSSSTVDRPARCRLR